jgi:hypothetical protein
MKQPPRWRGIKLRTCAALVTPWLADIDVGEPGETGETFPQNAALTGFMTVLILEYLTP